MTESYIEISEFSYNAGETEILKSISLSINKGEHLAVIGPNGAGKTTLLKCIMGFFKGEKGSIKINNVPITGFRNKDLAKLISYVPQADGRFLPFTVEEFVLMGRYPHLSPFTAISAKDRDKVTESIELTGISHLKKRLMSTLSGGECQTAFIAAAIAQEAGILLLDEPVAFLDPKHSVNIQKMLSRINMQLGKTLITVTHDINSAILNSDRIAALKLGEIKFVVKAEKAAHNSLLEKIYDTSFIFADHPITGKTFIAPEVIK